MSETKTPEGGYILEELSIGMSAEIAVEITHERIMSFAEASGDYNPIHIDEDYAKTTAYRGCRHHAARPRRDLPGSDRQLP